MLSSGGKNNDRSVSFSFTQTISSITAELGQDSCMGAYRWKSGSNYRGRSWDQDLPTDAQIVMHVFCTYMDSRLPTDARFPDGRTFTGLYFLKNLDKPGTVIS